MIRKWSSSLKFQVHNTALISVQTDTLFDEILTKPDEWGRIVESAIGSHLINQSHVNGVNLYYWRERNGEIDFVI